MYKRWDRVRVTQAVRGRYLKDEYRNQVGVVAQVTESIFVSDTSHTFVVELDNGKTVCVKEDYLKPEGSGQ